MEIKTIIEKVKLNDSDAFKTLLEEYTPLIYSIINGNQLVYGDYRVSKDDLFQEASLALLEACNKYRDDKGASFSTFAYMVINRKVKREYFRLVKPYWEETFSYDKYENVDYTELLSDKVIRDNDFVYAIKIKDDIDKILKTDGLSSSDKKILKLRIDNYSYKEIADKLNIDSKKVDNRLCRIKQKIRRNNIILNSIQ